MANNELIFYLSESPDGLLVQVVRDNVQLWPNYMANEGQLGLLAECPFADEMNSRNQVYI